MCGFCLFIVVPNLMVSITASQMPFGGDQVRAWQQGTPQPLGDGPVIGGTTDPGGTGGEIRPGTDRCPDVAVTAAGGTDFLWPADTTYISGWRFNPASHPGVDIGTKEGMSVYASETGTVIAAGWSAVGYGENIVLDHGNGWRTRYAHLSQLNVTCGQVAQRGSVIGLSGNTGRSTGPHLHFELASPQGRIDPCPAILGRAC
jgi:murein DD-endopeptidase MepM/ murein hydrolase activator NlpD